MDAGGRQCGTQLARDLPQPASLGQLTKSVTVPGMASGIALAQK